MDKKAIESEKGKPGERINRFIIECMFNKYFEEEKEDIVRRQEATPTEQAISAM